MKRHLLNVLTGLSLVLCIATVALWVRSYRTLDEIKCIRIDPLARTWSRQTLESWNGNILVDSQRTLFDKNGDTEKVAANEDYRPGWRFESTPTSEFTPPFRPRKHIWNRLGFFFDALTGRSPNTTFPETWSLWALLVPCWFIVLLTALLPLIVLPPYVRQRVRRVQGRCLACGYDLRATPNRCPECATVQVKAIKVET